MLYDVYTTWGVEERRGDLLCRQGCVIDSMKIGGGVGSLLHGDAIEHEVGSSVQRGEMKRVCHCPGVHGLSLGCR